MVSFQCEGCGDVQTKKKLDSHRNHCHAPFTCIDCMTTFHGVEYRSHTSCMTEDQKYQGHLYREKPAKAANKRKSVSILEPTDQNALVPHKPYVEDVLEEDDVPPAVPTPPSAIPAKKLDNVFDYMVDDQQQSTPKIMFARKKIEDGQEGEMTMKNNAPSVFTRPASRNSNQDGEDRRDDLEYDLNGYSYGTQPINPQARGPGASAVSLDFMTPAAKSIKSKLDQHREPGSVSHSRTNSGSIKRKRGHGEEQVGQDTVMQDAPNTIVRSTLETPGIVHSGLTGGLTRMVTKDEDYPFHRSPSSSPEPTRGAVAKKSAKDSPGSPLKRTRRSKEDSNGLGISIKSRAGKVLSMVGDAIVPAAYNADGAQLKNRRRTSSSDPAHERGEKRERKKHKVSRHNGTSSANVRHEPRTRRRASDETADGKKKMKAIEYHRPESNSDSEDGRPNGVNGQMVVFGAEEKTRKRCESFLSNVTKGSQSTHGYSVNKALKRWHRDRDVHGTSIKLDEEKELWKGLRLKRNDRGEVVVFFEGS